MNYMRFPRSGLAFQVHTSLTDHTFTQNIFLRPFPKVIYYNFLTQCTLIDFVATLSENEIYTVILQATCIQTHFLRFLAGCQQTCFHQYFNLCEQMLILLTCKQVLTRATDSQPFNGAASLYSHLRICITKFTMHGVAHLSIDMRSHKY